MRYLSTLCFLSMTLLWSCKNDPPKTVEVVTPPVKKFEQVSPTFSGDTAFSLVAKQVDFGPRIPGSEGWKKCGDFLVSFLKEQGALVSEQKSSVRTFDNKLLPIRNITARFLPDKKERIMLAAHWDTRPFSDQDQAQYHQKPIDGANDGGSGVAVLLEIARQLKTNHPQVGVDLVFFDLEDYGQPDGSDFPPMENSYCLGSQFWANSAEGKSYKPRFGILLDMVGAPGARFSMEGTSLTQAKEVVKKVWDLANDMGFADRFPYFQHSGIIDDHYYVFKLTGIKMIDIIEYNPETPSGFSQTWHTQSDNLGSVDRETMRIVGQTVLELIFRELP